MDPSVASFCTDSIPSAKAGYAFFDVFGSRPSTTEIPAPQFLSEDAEPWFLTFNADCEFRIAMTPEDLAKVGLEELGKKWARRPVRWHGPFGRGRKDDTQHDSLSKSHPTELKVHRDRTIGCA